MKTLLLITLAFFVPQYVFAAIPLTGGTWSTTFNCSEWTQGTTVSCDGVENGGGWTAAGKGDQITSGANNPDGGGGKGFRHWEADGSNDNGGGINVIFPSAQKELWVRWYQRYQAGFKWSPLTYDKILYFSTNALNISAIPEYQYDNYAIVAQATPDYTQVKTPYGWSEVQGGSAADGRFHCFEIHIKMDTTGNATDTSGANGIGQLWIDGVLQVNNIAVNWSAGDQTAQAGWTKFLVGSNQYSPSNGTPMYVDFDDIVVYNTTPPNRDANGNPFIGPLGTTTGGTTTGGTTTGGTTTGGTTTGGTTTGGTTTGGTTTGGTTTSGTTLFEETLADSSLSARGWYDNTSPVLSSTEVVAGYANSLEYHFPVGATTPTGGGPMRKQFAESDSVYLSYYVKYSSNYVGSNKSYHPHEFYLMTNADTAWTGMAYTYLTAYIEQNALHPRLAIQDGRNIDTNSIGQNLVNVTENRSVAGCNGDSDGYGNGDCYSVGSGTYWNGKLWTATGSTISTGSWHKVEVYFKLNSIVGGKGVADGVMQYWVDGSLLIDHKDVMFRTAQHPDMKFNQLIIAPYIGDGSPVDQTFWVDDIVLGTAPPTSSGSVPSTVEAPVVNIEVLPESGGAQ